MCGLIAYCLVGLGPESSFSEPLFVCFSLPMVRGLKGVIDDICMRVDGGNLE